MGTVYRRYSNLVAGFLGLLLAAGLGGCSKAEVQYSRDTPEEVFESARKMLEDGNAQRLVELITPPTEDNAIVYREAGRMLESLSVLASTIEEAYPKEIAELRSDAQAAAMRGDAVSNIQQALTGFGKRRGEVDSSDERLNALLQSLLGDPYGWIRQSETRLSTQYLYDGAVAVLWDDKPIMPPIGVIMQEDARDGTWSIVLPTNLPMVNKYLPKTKDEYKIWAMILRVLSNACNDLVTGIHEGDYATLEGVSKAAGEKAFAPIAMVFFAYQRAVSIRLKGDGGDD